jgi:hypothetical protein
MPSSYGGNRSNIDYYTMTLPLMHQQHNSYVALKPALATFAASALTPSSSSSLQASQLPNINRLNNININNNNSAYNTQMIKNFFTHGFGTSSHEFPLVSSLAF